jgi:homocysteine S-methyltransferase
LIQSRTLVLTEGAVIERLRRDPKVRLDDHVLTAGMIYDPVAREKLARIFLDYLAAGRRHGLPMLICAPIWRASREHLEASEFCGCDVNGDNIRALAEIRDQLGGYAKKVLVGGLMGCRGNAYDPRDSLPADAAREYHSWQASKMAAARPDFIQASTLPALDEALGMAKALAAFRIPYLLSFVLRPTGRLLDGTPLPQALDAIDQATDPRPAAYLINCTHPRVLMTALKSLPPLPRLVGLQANTSDKPPEELDQAEELHSQEPAPFAQDMLRLHRRFGLHILGGCCGTDNRHIEELGRLMAQQTSSVQQKSA